MRTVCGRRMSDDGGWNNRATVCLSALTTEYENLMSQSWYEKCLTEVTN